MLAGLNRLSGQTPFVYPAPFFGGVAPSEILSHPVAEADRIICGDKVLSFRKDGRITLNLDGTPVAIGYYFETGNSSFMGLSRGFSDLKCTFSREQGTYYMEGSFPLRKNEEVMGRFHLTVSIQSDGQILFETSYQVPRGYDDSVYSSGLIIQIPGTLCSGEMLALEPGGTRSLVVPDERQQESLFWGKPVKSVTFAPGSFARKITFRPEAPATLSAQFDRGFLSLRVNPVEGRARLLVDIRSGAAPAVNSESSWAGIDFWGADRLHVPDYGKSINLIQNASFESGFRYYANSRQNIHGDLDRTEYFRIQTGDALFGGRCLAVVPQELSAAMPGPSSYLQSFAIPVKKGAKYTLSCYVKGVKSGNADLILTAREGMVPFAMKAISPTEEWQRISVSAISPGNSAVVRLTATCPAGTRVADGRILVDGIQFQEGDLTDYADAPVSTELRVNETTDNTIDSQEKMDLRLLIHGSKGNLKGMAHILISDFFYQTVLEKTVPFTTNDQGEGDVRVTVDHPPRGLLSVRSDLAGDGFFYRDYYRISVLRFMDNTQKNRTIFTINMQETPPLQNPEGYFMRYRRVGLGGANHGLLSEEMVDKLHEYGITYFGTTMLAQPLDSVVDGKWQVDAYGVKLHGEMLAKWPRDIKSVTPELEKAVEDSAFQMVQAYPWQKYWSFDCETEVHYPNLSDADVARLVGATYRGAKRADPSAQVLLTDGPCNMALSGGTQHVLQLAQGMDPAIHCDGVGIHPYRTLPEQPDLDKDTEFFLDTLRNINYGSAPVFWTEGMYYSPYTIPAWGLTSYVGCSMDHWFGGACSYDIGWGERISAAYYVRSWLVALKYADRIRSATGWQEKMNFLDFDFTPYAWQSGCNALADLLGNADFKKDIRFAPASRSYVFEDEKRRPVAAVWSYIPEVDHGKRPAPVATMRCDDFVPEFIDMMGEPRILSKDKAGAYLIPVGSFPMFIRGPAGSLDKLCAALRGATMEDLSGKGSLEVSARLANLSQVSLRLSNVLSRPWLGMVQVMKNSESISIPALGTSSRLITLDNPVVPDRIVDIPLPVVLKDDKVEERIDAGFPAFAAAHRKDSVHIDGIVDDWKNVPAIPIPCRVPVGKGIKSLDKEEPREADFKVTWDEDFLYLLVHVKDSQFSADDTIPVADRWKNASLQVYMDTACDARENKLHDFDKNDYEFDFFPAQDGKSMICYRRFMPEQQLAGGIAAPLPEKVEPNIAMAFSKTPDGYVYEIAFPKWYILPVKLQENSTVGLGLFVNYHDHDRERLSGLSLFPKECYRNPDLFPIMILSQ